MNNVYATNRLNARNIAIIGLLGALTAVLGMTPLGFIPIGLTRATIMHIPVIIGAILYGPMVGAFVGLVFGVFSLINALVNMTPVSFVFINPLISILPRVLIGIGTHYVYQGIKKVGTENFKGILAAVWTAIIGYLGYGVYKNVIAGSWVNMTVNFVLISIAIGLAIFGLKNFKNESLDVVMAAAAGTLINTFGVLSLIYFLYGERFVAAMGEDINMARNIIFGIGLVNGIPEIIIAIILVSSVVNMVRKKR